MDGRRRQEPRDFRARAGVLESADGSGVFEMGATKVLAEVRGPARPEKRDERPDKGALRVDYATAPFAGGERRKRGKGDRQEGEAGEELRRELEAATVLESFPRASALVRITVLQVDGGARACALNAAALALSDAGIPMKGLLGSCSASLVGGTPVIDPCGAEASGGGPEIRVAAFPQGGLVGFHGDGKARREGLTSLLALARSGCEAASARIRSACLARASLLASTMPRSTTPPSSQL